jgi:dsDNA-specific endonuclease/ATPase MutS2
MRQIEFFDNFAVIFDSIDRILVKGLFGRSINISKFKVDDELSLERSLHALVKSV